MTQIKTREAKKEQWQIMGTQYELSYKSRWNSPWFVVREFMQNALDEHDLQGVDELPVVSLFGNTLIIEDKGRGLGAEALLLRESKSGTNLRGHFGEGLKWACICALRLGYEIEISSPKVDIIPIVERKRIGSVKADLVSFKWRGRKRKTLGTKVTIKGYKSDLYRDRFFPLIPMPYDIAYGGTHQVGQQIHRDAVLLSDNCHNHLYVKDIYTKDFDGAPSSFCYNVWDCDLDPDRVQVRNSVILHREVTKVWGKCDDPHLIKQLLLDIKNDKAWECGIWWDDDVVIAHPKVWQEAWNRVYGKNAVLRTDQYFSSCAAGIGFVVPEIPKRMVALLLTAQITTDRQVAEKSINPDDGGLVIIPDDQLLPRQANNLEILRWLLRRLDFYHWRSLSISVGNNTDTFSWKDISVFVAHMPSLDDGGEIRAMGLATGTTVFISVEGIEAFQLALMIMCHELAHLASNMASDMTTQHALEIERVWQIIADTIITERGNNMWTKCDCE